MEEPETNVNVSGQKIVVIDPGHGGDDPGAVGYNSAGKAVAYESHINLAIALLVGEKLEKSGKMVIGYTIYEPMNYMEDGKLTGFDTEFAEAVCENLYHLFVTCNKNGALSKRAEGAANCFAINLTDETHDQSFAMTSSFTNMYLACLLCFELNRLDEVCVELESVVACGEKFVEEDYKVAKEVVEVTEFEEVNEDAVDTQTGEVTTTQGTEDNVEF